MRLIQTSGFTDSLRSLTKRNPILSKKVKKSLKFLKQNLNHPSLRLHKIQGTNNYSVSVDMSLRIIVHIEGASVFLLNIGYHDEVY